MSDTIRLKALQLAINEYMSDSVDATMWEELDEAELIEYLEEYSVWQPFEYWPIEDVIEQIESLASTVTQCIHSCKGLE